MIDDDPFVVLGLTPGASRDEIKRSYRRLAMRWHPDRNAHSKAAEERFKAIKAAYELASDAEAYAAWLAERRSAAVSPDVASDIAPEPTPEAPASAAPSKAPPRDIVLDVDLALAARGGVCHVDIDDSLPCADCDGSGQVDSHQSVPCPDCRGIGRVRGKRGAAHDNCATCAGRGYVRRLPCKPCQGTGRLGQQRTYEVRVPAGLREGETLRLTREEGDVHLRLHLLPHPCFTLIGDDLHATVPVNALRLLAGGTLTLPTLSGETLVVDISEGFERPRVISGRGYPRREGGGVVGAGDLHLSLHPVWPRHLNATEAKALLGLADKLEKRLGETLPEVATWRAGLA